MPSVETGITLGFILLGYAGFVKCRVGGMFEGSSSETLVISHSTVADELDLGYARDGLEIRMKNGRLCGLSLVVAMPIALGLRIESLKCGGKTMKRIP
jgi:hypothetical protein